AHSLFNRATLSEVLHNQFIANHAAKDGQDSGNSQAQNDILRIGVILGLNLNLLFADTGGNKRIPEKPDFRHTMRSTNQRCNYPRNRYALNITVGIFPTHGKLSNDTATQKPRDHKWTHHQSGNNRPHDIVDKGRTML